MTKTEFGRAKPPTETFEPRSTQGLADPKLFTVDKWDVTSAGAEKRKKIRSVVNKNHKISEYVFFKKYAFGICLEILC